MKAIITRYLGPTNTKPSRIVAKAEGVKPEIWSCDELDNIREKDSLQHITNHQAAARILAAKYGWSTNLASGGLPNNDWAHCFIPDVVVETLKLGRSLFDVVSCSERFDGLKEGITASIKSLNA